MTRARFASAFHKPQGSMMLRLETILVAFGLSLAATQGHAAVCAPSSHNDCDPPSGNVIFDLAGQPLPHVYTQYTVIFTAAQSTTNLGFQFRDDPAFLYLDDVVLQHSGTGANLVINGGFEAATYPAPFPQPTGWIYSDPHSVQGGEVADFSPHKGLNAYTDGSVGAYDGISQQIATIAGDAYTLTFWVYDDGSHQLLGSRTNVAGPGNPGGEGDDPPSEGFQQQGDDLLVYADALPTAPTAIPEPGSIALLSLGIAGLALARRRKAH